MGAESYFRRFEGVGNGIEITDTSGGTGNLIIADNSSTTAAELGIAGTYSAATASVQGANLQRQWIGTNTLLSTFNGGVGMTRGSSRSPIQIKISTEIDLTQGNEVTVQDVIDEINSKGISVTARSMRMGMACFSPTRPRPVRHEGGGVSGRTAADLNILGTATGTTIDEPGRRPSPSAPTTHSPTFKRRSTNLALAFRPASSTMARALRHFDYRWLRETPAGPVAWCSTPEAAACRREISSRRRMRLSSMARRRCAAADHHLQHQSAR